jgi:hypothetical protein
MPFRISAIEILREERIKMKKRKSGGGETKKITFKKLISIALSVALITTSIPARAAEASWFSDFCGGFFTILTAPIWVFCPDNPTFRKNNPFKKKVWEETKFQVDDFYIPSKDETKPTSIPLPSHLPTINLPKPATDDTQTDRDTISSPSIKRTLPIIPCTALVDPSPNPPATRNNKYYQINNRTFKTDTFSSREGEPLAPIKVISTPTPAPKIEAEAKSDDSTDHDIRIFNDIFNMAKIVVTCVVIKLASLYINNKKRIRREHIELPPALEWDETESTWYNRPLIDLLYQPQMIYDECGAVGGLRIGHKNHTKKKNKFSNTITQYRPRPLLHNVCIAHAMNRMPKKTFLPISPSVLSSQSVGSVKQP